MPPLTRQLRWLIAIRVVVITSVVLPYFLLQLGTAPEELTGFEFLYVLAGVTYLLTLGYIALLQLLPQRPELNGYVQFGGDLLLVTALVYQSGGIASPFSMLYLVVVAVASTLLRREAGFAVATAAYVLYAGLALGLFYAWWPEPRTGMAEAVSVWRLTYNLGSHLLGFYAVALLTSYLAHTATQAERELKEKREDLADLQVVHQEVVQSVSSGLITTDLAGRITSVNRAGEEILQIDQSRLLGRPIQAAVSLFEFEEEQWAEEAPKEGPGRRLRSETRWEVDGTTRFIGYSVSRLTEAGGRHKGFIVSFQDLTDARKLEEELRLKDRMAAVGELAAGMAHEIGNPLAAISGSVQILSSAVKADPSQRRLLEVIRKESDRLDRTVKGFLRFARPKERSTVKFDIARLLRENLDLLRNSDEVGSDHRLEIDLEPDAAIIFADPDQISQLFWNLVRNSLRAMPDGGTLRVIGRLKQDAYRLQFEDSGRGMAAEERARLFEPFQGFFDGGSGIGMAIVYQIVQEHRGRIAVESDPGQGTRISIDLPASHSPVPPVPVER